MTEIEELENKIKELTQELNQLKDLKRQDKVKDKRWRAKKGEDYNYIFDNGALGGKLDMFELSDNFHYSTGNYFREPEQLYDTIKKLQIYTKLKDLALSLNKGIKIRWDIIAQKKYYIYAIDERNALIQGSVSLYRNLGQIYCLDKDFFEKAKIEIGIEDLNFLYGIKK